MPRPTNAEIYDAEFKAANGNVSTRTIALSAMFTLQKLMEKERKSRKKVISVSDNSLNTE